MTHLSLRSLARQTGVPMKTAVLMARTGLLRAVDYTTSVTPRMGWMIYRADVVRAVCLLGLRSCGPIFNLHDIGRMMDRYGDPVATFRAMAFHSGEHRRKLIGMADERMARWWVAIVLRRARRACRVARKLEGGASDAQQNT